MVKIRNLLALSSVLLGAVCYPAWVNVEERATAEVEILGGEESEAVPTAVIQQEPLLEVFSQFAGVEEDKINGFVDGGIELSSNTVTIKWHGKVTLQAQRIIDEAAAKGILVNLQLVKFTEDELSEMAANLVHLLRTETDLQVSRYGPNADYDGIELGGPHLVSSPEAQRRILEIAANEYPAIRISFVPESEPRYLMSHRRNDTGSFDAADVISRGPGDCPTATGRPEVSGRRYVVWCLPGD